MCKYIQETSSNIRLYNYGLNKFTIVISKIFRIPKLTLTKTIDYVYTYLQAYVQIDFCVILLHCPLLNH